MSDPTGPTEGYEASAGQDEQNIRRRARELTSQMLKGARPASQTAEPGTGPAAHDAGARQAFAAAVREFDDAMLKSAQSAHLALEELASRGADFSENDIKDALAGLRALEARLAAAAGHVASAASGNLRRELKDLAARTGRVGADTGARVTSTLGDFAGRLATASRHGAATGLEVASDYGARVASVTSGILAGVADALREQSGNRKTPR